jgi:mannosyltransferase OCH1-like enzyme
VFSNLARLSLLRRFGGVWTDATAFCCQPLDSWLEPYAKEGFFAFRNPGPDRLMANWFIAANPDNEILARLHRDYVALWEHNRFLSPKHKFTRFSRRAFSRLFGRDPKSTVYWFGFPRKILKVFPHYIFHYTFNKLVFSDPAVARTWNESVPFEATQPRRLTKLATNPDGMTAALDCIDQGSSPLYKLNWRIDIEAPYWKAVLSRLRSKLNCGATVHR